MDIRWREHFLLLIITTAIIFQYVHGERMMHSFLYRRGSALYHPKNRACATMLKSVTATAANGDYLDTGKLYTTIYQGSICGGNTVMVKCPTIDQMSICFDEICYSDEIMKEEMDHGSPKFKASNRFTTFIGGRVAIRRAYALHKKDENFDHEGIPAILKNDLGAPMLPKTISGSISHKDHYAVGATRLYDRVEDDNNKAPSSGHLGVDLERCTSKAHARLQERLLTDNEQMTLGRLSVSSSNIQVINMVNNMDTVNKYENGTHVQVNDETTEVQTVPVTIEEEVLLRFSFKESVFKAVNPYVKRYVDFSEAEIFPSSDGTAIIYFRLKTGELFEYSAEWKKIVMRCSTIGDSEIIEKTEDREFWLTAVYLYNPHSNTCD